MYTIKATSFGGILQKAGLKPGGYVKKEFGDPAPVPSEFTDEISNLYNKVDATRW